MARDRLRFRPTVTAPASIDWEARKLVVRLRQRSFELPLPEHALQWLKKREREVEPLEPAPLVHLRKRGSKLDVLLVLEVKRPKPGRPDPKSALLVYVRAHSYGFAAVIASYDGERVKVHETLVLVPRAVRKSLRASSAPRRLRVPESFGARRWVDAAAAGIFRKAVGSAAGRPILMNVDVPGDLRTRMSAVLAIRRVAGKLAKWYGVYAEFRSHPSRACPLCGAELREAGELGRGLSRVVQCACGFREDADFVPFHHWVRGLGLPPPEHPIRQLRLAQRGSPSAGS